MMQRIIVRRQLYNDLILTNNNPLLSRELEANPLLLLLIPFINALKFGNL